MNQLFCLSGFLGLSSDWDFLKNSPFRFQACSAQDFLNPEKDKFQDAAKKINDNAKQLNCDIAVGYSLGGRLLMNALLQKPDQWKAAIIISAHPGLSQDTERRSRVESDRAWGEKFLEMPWNQLLKEWNEQAVFQGKPSSLQREEKQFKRDELTRLLCEFSLGFQRDLRDELASLKTKILFIAGENDTQYVSLVNELVRENSAFKKQIVKNSGHRVFWEQNAELKNEFIKTVQEFLKENTWHS